MTQRQGERKGLGVGWLETEARAAVAVGLWGGGASVRSGG